MNFENTDNIKEINIKNRTSLRNRFLEENSFENFDYKQTLEFILYYSMNTTSKNINNIAEQLLDEFGDFHTLLDTKTEDIIRKYDISESAAVLISMLPSLFKKYIQSRLDMKEVINSPDTAYKYLEPLFLGKRIENFCMLCLNKNKNLIKALNVTAGNAKKIHIYVDKITETTIRYDAQYVIIAHNHPGGTDKPSQPDIDLTYTIINALKTIKVELLDHIIFYDNKYFSFAKNNCCELSLTIGDKNNNFKEYYKIN